MIKGTFDKRIRNILLKRATLSQEKAEEAATVAEKEQKGYVDILLDRGYVQESDFLSCLSQETDLPPIDMEKLVPEEKAIQSLSQDWAQYYGVLPLARLGNLLTLAVSNPFDIVKLDDLRLLTGCDIRPVLSTERALRKALPRSYNPGEEEMQKILQGVDRSEELTLQAEQEDEQINLQEVSAAAEDSPVVRLVNQLILKALDQGASDIHIEPFEKSLRVRYRVDGILNESATPPKKLASPIVSRLKILSQLDIAERRIPQDGKFQVTHQGRQIDFRVSVLPSVHGEKVVMRVLDSSGLAHSLDSLGFEPEALAMVRKAINAPYGMILITGPTGSGKSTTLYSCVREVLNDEDNIVTVEDPVEYQIHGVTQVPVNIKKGLTFPIALRSILRQDPDIILIGEIRDTETADIAVKAAITGHLVLSTLHTNDAVSSVPRLADMRVDPFMIASSVLLVAAQRLCRKLCENCRKRVEAPPERLLELGARREETDSATLYGPVGCSRCVNGYKGRFALLEVLLVDDEIRRMIVRGTSAIELKEYAIAKAGMLTLRRAGILNALRGKTSIEEVLRNTMGDTSI